MGRKPKKFPLRRKMEEGLNEIAIRASVVIVLCYAVLFFAARPKWVVKAVQVLDEVVRGAAAF